MYRFLGAVLGILLLSGLLSFSFTADADTSGNNINQDDYLELSSELEEKTKNWDSDKIKDFKQFCWDLKSVSKGDLIVIKHNYYGIKSYAVVYKILKISNKGLILKINNNFESPVFIMRIWPASRLLRVYERTISIIIRDNEARLYASRAF